MVDFHLHGNPVLKLYLNQIQSNSETKRNRASQTPGISPRWPSGADKSAPKTAPGRNLSILHTDCDKQPGFKLEKGRKSTYCLELLFGSVITQSRPPQHPFLVWLGAPSPVEVGRRPSSSQTRSGGSVCRASNASSTARPLVRAGGGQVPPLETAMSSGPVSACRTWARPGHTLPGATAASATHLLPHGINPNPDLPVKLPAGEDRGSLSLRESWQPREGRVHCVTPSQVLAPGCCPSASRSLGRPSPALLL